MILRPEETAHRHDVPKGLPPSTEIIEPVVKGRSLTAALTAAATSSGVARRPSGVAALWASIISVGMRAAYSPRTQPGETDTTRMKGARARPSERVIESSAALDAQ